MKATIENSDAFLLQHHARGFERCRIYVRHDMDEARRHPQHREIYLRSARQWAGFAREHYQQGMAAADALSNQPVRE